MKTLKTFEFQGFGGGDKGRYDWAKLLDGGIYQLTEGEDFKCKPKTLQMMARNQAKKKGLKLKANMVEGGIVIQAVEPSLMAPVASMELMPDPEAVEPSKKKKGKK
jgi:hypothetical protein